MDATPPDPTTPNPYEPPVAAVKPRPGELDRVVSLLGRLAAVALIFLASLIAFVATCVPVGFGIVVTSAGNRAGEYALIPACLVGLMVAVLVGYFLTKVFFRRTPKI